MSALDAAESLTSPTGSALGVEDVNLKLLYAEHYARLLTEHMRTINALSGVMVADENADFAGRLDHQARMMLNELDGLGLRRRDVDKDILDDAAAMMLRSEVDDAAEAYERALARRVELDRDGRPGASAAADDVPFPEAEARPAAKASDAFPAGDTSPSDAMKNARGLFRTYKRSFAPRGTGDTAGRNLQKIVDRDATPNEVASMLFGGASGRVSGRQLETLDRLREVVGTDSDAWRAVQQATIGKYLEGRDVGRSLDYLLRGEGRELADRVLTPQQRSGLDAFRRGTIQAENARTSAPEWVSDLAKGGYDPNRVLTDLFGSGVPGARPGQALYGRGLKQYLGADSAEWSGLRQAAWLQLVQQGKGAGRLSPAREAERIRAFVDGEGKGLAQTMFNAGELGLMRRYADAIRNLELPKGVRASDDSRAASLGAHVLNAIVGAIGFKLAGPGRAIGAYGARVGQRALQGGLNAGRASRSFEEGAPRVPAPMSFSAGRFGFGGVRGSGLLGSELVPSY